jgi:hypothetical protein
MSKSDLSLLGVGELKRVRNFPWVSVWGLRYSGVFQAFTSGCSGKLGVAF